MMSFSSGFFFFFNAHPYVKYPDREIRICCVMCDADNVSLQAALIAHVGRSFGSLDAAEGEQLTVLPGGTEHYLCQIYFDYISSSDGLKC